MFKQILIPTDGSPVANKAAKAGVALAHRLGAKVTAYCSLPGDAAMKRSILFSALTVAALSAPAAFAQDTKPAPAKPAMSMDMMQMMMEQMMQRDQMKESMPAK